MSILEAVLAIIGVVLLIVLAIAFLSDDPPAPTPRPEDDLAAPYREGLHAAIRMQGVAQELEQQLYVEAVRYAEASVSQREQS
jgi:hypothetical protein